MNTVKKDDVKKDDTFFGRRLTDDVKKYIQNKLRGDDLKLARCVESIDWKKAKKIQNGKINQRPT